MLERHKTRIVPQLGMGSVEVVELSVLKGTDVYENNRARMRNRIVKIEGLE
jgi:hypothetical protein